MSLTLGIDTSTDIRVGLAKDGEVLVSRAVTDRRAHVELALPLVREVMAAAKAEFAELTEIGVGVGPGPFTGLRVGVVAALTLAEVLGVQVKGVCSLDVIALDWAERGDAPAEFVVVTDARRKEVYWARYDATGTRLDAPVVAGPEQVPELPLAGSGASLTGRVSTGPTEFDAGLLAASLGRFTDAGLEPLYLRRPDAEVPTKRKSTLVVPRIAMMGPK
jgi:tRNA threonylcarbamoyl adenosine modification protein YeaZ